MSDDQNTTQNQNSKTKSQPSTIQEPTEPVSENTGISEPAYVPLEAPESPPEGFEMKSTDIPSPTESSSEAQPPSENTPEIETADEIKTEEKSRGNEDVKGEKEEKETPTNELVNVVQMDEPEEIPKNDPLSERVKENEQEIPKSEKPETSAAQTTPSGPRAPETKVREEPEVKAGLSTVQQPKELIKEKIVYSLIPIKNLLGKANEMLRLGRRKKLEKILALIVQKGKVRNDDVQKLLRVSDATATRYLTQMEKEGKIKRHNKGKYSHYSKN